MKREKRPGRKQEEDFMEKVLIIIRISSIIVTEQDINKIIKIK